MGSTPIISTKNDSSTFRLGYYFLYRTVIWESNPLGEAEHNRLFAKRMQGKALQISPSPPKTRQSTDCLVFYPLRKQWYIIAIGVYHHALACISSTIRLHCFHNDDIQSFALVICNFFEIDDIHGFAVI